MFQMFDKNGRLITAIQTTAVASDVSYDNATSGLSATNVQTAIDEVDNKIDTLTTTNVAEGTNLYHTAARVLAVLLTGLSTATNSAILATDTIIIAFGKLQAQINGLVTGVSSVFGRTGAVTAQNGDYTASQITNVPAGNITALEIQAAINELDTEKEPVISAGTTAQYWRGDKSWQTLNNSAVGLGNVSNDAQLKIASNLSDLNNAATARTNLGLGDSATRNVGTTAGTVSAGDDSRFTERDVSYYRKTGTTTYEAWYGSFISGFNPGTVGLAKDVLRGYPFIVSKQMTLDRIQIEITVAGSAGSVAGLAIYNTGSDLYPSSLVLDCGTVAIDTTGVKQITISQTLSPGLYVLAINHNSTSNPSFRSIGNTNAVPAVWGIPSNNFANGINTCAEVLAHTFGAFPATYPATATIIARTIIAILVRASA